MTENTPTPSVKADIHGLLQRQNESQKIVLTIGEAETIARYIRTLEKQNTAMKDVLSHVENFEYGDEEVTMVKAVLSSFTL